MANTTGWSCQHSASVIAETNTTATIRVDCLWKNDNARYNVSGITGYVYCNSSEQIVLNNGSVVTTDRGYNDTKSLGYYDYVINKGTSAQSISCYAKIKSTSSYAGNQTKSSTAANVTIAAKPSYTVSYNANGGSGAPGNQTKWYDTNLTLSSVTPARTGYNFIRWNTNTSNTGTAYSPGAIYTGNANLTLYAIWQAHTYTVNYNANGGSGAPSNQTKTYGVNLTLSTTKPTRTNYNFLGWSTSANGSVVYAAGATYTANSAVTLYAVWELAYTKPRITNFAAQRCNSGGTASESGTYVKATFNWATDKTVSAIKIQYKTQTATSWTDVSVSASGTSGSVSQVFGSGGISTETSYHVRAYVTDSGGTTYSTQVSIGTTKFPIDVKAGGTGISFGKVAEEDNLMDVNFPAKFRNSANFQNGLKLNDKNVLDVIYPVGSIYMSVNSTNPGTLFGGTWSQITNTFLLACGSSYSAGSTGGAATVTLTAAQSGIPAHNHGLNGHVHSYYADFYIRHGNGSGTASVAAGTNTSVTENAYGVSWGNGFSVGAYSHNPDRITISGTTGGADGVTANNGAANASQAHNNMPPYLAVYVWKRTA